MLTVRSQDLSPSPRKNKERKENVIKRVCLILDLPQYTRRGRRDGRKKDSKRRKEDKKGEG